MLTAFQYVKSQVLMAVSRLCGPVSNQVCVNPHTHLPTYIYLYANFNHHPSKKEAVLSTEVQRARALCDHESLHDELEFLRQNSYGDQQI
jgi:hypothetical protein